MREKIHPDSARLRRPEASGRSQFRTSAVPGGRPRSERTADAWHADVSRTSRSVRCSGTDDNEATGRRMNRGPRRTGPAGSVQRAPPSRLLSSDQRPHVRRVGALGPQAVRWRVGSPPSNSGARDAHIPNGVTQRQFRPLAVGLPEDRRALFDDQVPGEEVGASSHRATTTTSAETEALRIFREHAGHAAPTSARRRHQCGTRGTSASSSARTCLHAGLPHRRAADCTVSNTPEENEYALRQIRGS